MDEKSRQLRRLPQVDALARRDDLAPVLDRAGRALGVRLLQRLQARWRRRILDGTLSGEDLDRQLEGLPEILERQVAEVLRSALVGVVNATGVIVHTNLGRAVLCPAARDALDRVMGGYSNLEYDLEKGARGSRLAHLDRHLERLFPGRAGIAVNNNAAALLLALNTLAAGREVVVSRGELVEIGGSFRIPEIMERSTAVLREVGTTNRTRIEDYRRAVGPATALLLKVHPSNYRILGFAEEASTAELAALGKEAGLPLLMDQGSGNLLDLSRHGIGEPPVSALLDDGADLVLFSGDKLLGGPQAGLAVGRPDLVAALRASPMARALRLDKGTLAALEATLGEYVRGTALEEIPVLRMVAADRDSIAARAERLAARLRGGIPADVHLVDGGSVVGGGAWPLGELATCLVALRPHEGEAGRIEAALRRGRPPVVARIEEGSLLVDLRTVLPEDEPVLEAALRDAFGRGGSGGAGGA